MTEAIGVGILTLGGVVIGSVGTGVMDALKNRQAEEKARRLQCIEQQDSFVPQLSRIEGIIDSIQEFMEADFSDQDEWEENSRTYQAMRHLYGTGHLYFWDDFKKQVYRLLPKTVTKACFFALDSVMQETKTLSEDLYNALEGESDVTECIGQMQMCFRKTKSKYLAAKYARHLLAEEFAKTINKASRKNVSKAFFKKYKKEILAEIKKVL